ncbi:methyltransferase [uncultured Desulfuromusa sp.]|uniref:class I SAM-dependent methyltransferase n=1 Tax=uncultured Desulfuromusa sp. TaxID=219183 RepID=UPI002AA7C2C1|nr:methyltransferase [uncultured Desulfuromusa sp.]
MTNVTKSYDRQAENYDEFIKKLVPDYEVFQNLLPNFIGAAAKVLDIGCGTGNTALKLRQQNPSLQLTCLDTSPQMLEIARNKLGNQHNYVETSIEKFDPQEQFDAITSVMVMHNIQTTADRLGAYRKIYGALKPGGQYLSVDIFKGESDRLQDVYMMLWRQFMLQSLPESEIDEKWLPLHREKDKPLKLFDQIEILNKTGFKTVDIAHKRFQFAMLIAQK